MRYICPVCNAGGSNGVGEKDRLPRPLCHKCNFKVTMIPATEHARAVVNTPAPVF